MSEMYGVTNGGDSWSSVISGLPYPLFFYAYSREKFGSYEYSYSVPMSQCPTIQNVQYCPFLEWSDMELVKIPYDRERFGADPLRPPPSYIPQVYRIKNLKTINKEVGYILPWRNINADVGPGKLRKWQNESKMYQHPYRKIFISDGMNTPLEIKNYLLKYEGSENKIKVKLNLSDRMSYGIYVQGYKNDTTGLYEAMVSGDSLTLPASSSAYTQWLATSKNQTATQAKQIIQSSFLGAAQQNTMLYLESERAKIGYMVDSTNAMASSALNPFAWASTATGIAGANTMRQVDDVLRAQQQQNNKDTHELTKKFAIHSAIATAKDHASTPPTMLSMGSDFMYGFNNQQKKLKVSTFDVTDEVAVQLGDYFAKYGYMANKIMNLDVNIKTRHFFNYIKTADCNARSITGVSKNFINEINEIFNRGVTLWHKEHSDVKMYDYKFDNYETNRWG